MVKMYERTRPVCAGDTVFLVPTENMATANVRQLPKKSSRRPSCEGNRHQPTCIQ